MIKETSYPEVVNEELLITRPINFLISFRASFYDPRMTKSEALDYIRDCMYSEMEDDTQRFSIEIEDLAWKYEFIEENDEEDEPVGSNHYEKTLEDKWPDHFSFVCDICDDLIEGDHNFIKTCEEMKELHCIDCCNFDGHNRLL